MLKNLLNRYHDIHDLAGWKIWPADILTLIFVFIIKVMFERIGYTVDICSSGSEGLDAFRQAGLLKKDRDSQKKKQPLHAAAFFRAMFQCIKTYRQYPYQVRTVSFWIHR